VGIVADGSSIEWTQATWNPTTGCDIVSSGCDNCLAPDTPVLMADMTWRPIAKIAPGDEIVGFTETPGLGQNRIYERATVVHAWTTKAEAVEITVGDRSIVASTDHRFLANVRPYWREAQRLTLHTSVIDLGMPMWLPDTDAEPYLAAISRAPSVATALSALQGQVRTGPSSRTCAWLSSRLTNQSLSVQSGHSQPSAAQTS
jgi:hypothetical protein